MKVLQVGEKYVTAESDYGVKVPAVVEKNNFFGTQFHPEKSDYEQYMKQYYIKRGDPSSAGQSFTHTRIPSQEHGVSGGTFCIPTEKLPEFWAKYSKHVVTNRRHEYLTEKQLQPGGPILVDLDFRYGPHIDARQHTKDDIENIKKDKYCEK